jgi:glutathione peroxidase
MSLTAASIHDFTVANIDGQNQPLAAYKGKVMLIVNTASQCGYTPQYKGLQSLYQRFQPKGLVVAGFPANNFGGQEPGSNSEIKTFCTRQYKVTFPMFAKVSVKGTDQAPLFQYLTQQKGGDIRWNFTKFLIGKDGQIIARFEPGVDPESPEILTAIEKALQ